MINPLFILIYKIYRLVKRLLPALIVLLIAYDLFGFKLKQLVNKGVNILKIVIKGVAVDTAARNNVLNRDFT